MHMRIGTSLVLGLVLPIVIICIGCSDKQSGDEPTKSVSQEGLEKLTLQAAQKTADAKKVVKENQEFFASGDIQLSSAALRTIDAHIRPVLIRQFGAAKVIEQNNEPVSESPQDLTLNSMIYVVRQALNEANARELHAAIEQAEFTPSIRLGRKPTVTKTWAAMSFLKRIEKVPYSIALYIDFAKQTITLKSYKPGSPYDTGQPLHK